MRLLRVMSVVEAASLAVLLANLLTVHAKAITTYGGPLHGIAYLAVVLAVSSNPSAAGARWRALVPGIGGLLALRALRGRSRPQES
ncbi:DUF3817 domain-containing protein [Nonomuraea sp. NPDC050783]|uniref:DUF3817 domain-containing protein n=1 Tax=Nonomuraea sp. NPDC050783 TaxID=3154634 RepID=UPI003465DFAE